METKDDTRANVGEEPNEPAQRSVTFDIHPAASAGSDSAEHKARRSRNLTKLGASTIHRQTGNHYDLSSGRIASHTQSVVELDAPGVTDETRGKRQSVWQTAMGRKSTLATSAGPYMTEKHYRIRSAVPVKRRNIFSFLCKPMDYSTWISNYVRWTLRAGFFQVSLTIFIAFWVLIVIFASIVFGMSRQQPYCISGLPEGNTATYMDTIQLSWTTLSTVGYGLIAPTTQKNQCLGFNVLMAVESFVGVLFASITGAIIFGKVARVQSVAPVLFSHPICVRYGTGVMLPSVDEESGDDDDVEVGDKKLELPCPILEFRLINELSHVKGGEVQDARVSVVATTSATLDKLKDESSRGTDSCLQALPKTALTAAISLGSASSQAASALPKTALTAAKSAAKSTGAALFGAGKYASQATGNIVQRLNYQMSRSPKTSLHPEDDEPYNEKEVEAELEKEVEAELEKEFAARFVEKLVREQERTAGVSLIEETRSCVLVSEGDSKLAPARLFHKLEIETDTHPFFKRTWNIRHVLDSSSPLLSLKARRMIEENGGYWPEKLNNHESVRKHLHFQEIIVNFEGTASVSGSAVFAHTVYDFVDVNVGYTFAQVLCLSKDGRLVVDAALLNDVKEQNGGGAEPLTDITQEGIVEVALDAANAAAQGVTDAANAAAKGVTDAAVGVQKGVAAVL